MAGDQRPGRLRLGHGRRRRHAPLSRPARGRSAGAAWPHGDAQSPDGTGSLARRPHRALGGERVRRRAAGAARPGYFREFRLESGLPVWRWEIDGSSWRNVSCCPHEQNTVHISYRLVAGEGTVRLKLRPAVHFRPHDERSARVRPALRADRRRDRYEISGRYGPAAACDLRCTAGEPPSPWKASGPQPLAVPGRREPRLRVARRIVESRPFPHRSDDGSATRRWWPRPRNGRRSSALRRTTPAGGARTAASGCWRWPTPAARTRSGRANGRWRPTSSSSRRPAASRRRRAPGGRRRGAHRDRRLSLVHRLGPRHHD